MKNKLFNILNFIAVVLFIALIVFISFNANTQSISKIFHALSWSIFGITLWRQKYTALFVHSIFLCLLLVVPEHFQFTNTAISYSYSLLVFALSSIFILLDNFISRGRTILKLLYWALCVLILIIPLSFFVYQLQFGVPVSKEILYALFQTNSNESIEYVHEFISPSYIFLLLGFFVFTGLILTPQRSFVINKTPQWIILLGSVIYLAITPLPKLPIMFWEVSKTYQEELRLFNETLSKRRVESESIKAVKKGRAETHIVVIGESLHKGHMSLYGYPRKSTPNLDSLQHQDGFILFDKVYANHTHTIEVLSLALTEANQYNDKEFYTSLSILDILKASNTESYWITNQVLKGAWDNIVSVMAQRADHLIGLNASVGANSKMQYFDGRCIQEVQHILGQSSDKNRVIFIQLMGSHSPYDTRYPKTEFSPFKGFSNQGDVGFKASKIHNLHYYENSIVYNDYVVSQLLELLQQHNGVSSFLYFSDHADDVVQKKGHNSGAFTYEMTEIPMMIWMSEDYRKQYPEVYPQLLENRDLWFSNDLLFNTMLGIFQIESPHHDNAFDYSSSAYSLDESRLKVLHKRAFTADENYLYWQKFNIDYLTEKGLNRRIIPHRVNSLAKLNQVWRNGMRSFEVDVYYNDSINGFLVGHDKGVMGHSLETFLNRISHTELQKVWLDFKNLNNQNYTQALSELQRLDTIFHLKEKALIESATTESIFQKFSQDGWTTSYYLPTTEILRLLEKNDREGQKKLARIIGQQLSEQKTSAISFDDKLYPFVKNYLEQLILPSLHYHVWYGPLLRSPKFKEELQNNKLFLDSRVKTILSPYYSQFNL